LTSGVLLSRGDTYYVNCREWTWGPKLDQRFFDDRATPRSRPPLPLPLFAIYYRRFGAVVDPILEDSQTHREDTDRQQEIVMAM
jgi:hypothetical protein